MTMGSSRKIAALAFALAALLPSGAGAEVVSSSDAGFIVRSEAVVAAPASEAYNALARHIARWWDPAHTFSGDSRNLSLKAEAGGCFCESLPGGGSVRHLEVVFVSGGKMLRMSGALGPLQGSGLAGSMTWTFAANGDSTKVELAYVVGGYFEGDLREMAPLVDSVLSGQLARFKRFVETGSPELSGRGGNALVAEAWKSDMDRFSRMTALLFPETESWESVASMPHLDMERFQKDKWSYRMAYLNHSDEKMESPECSFITRLLYETQWYDVFRSVDFNGDGVQDIIYTGDAKCREGRITVIWTRLPGTGPRYDAGSWSFLALKMDGTGSGEKRICGVSPGCCGDWIDWYRIRDFANKSDIAGHRVRHNLDLPGEMTMADDHYVAEKELSLRSSPKKDNSETDARYSKGAEGTIVAGYIDAEGARWGLIVMDQESREYVIGSRESVTAGWIALGDSAAEK